MVMANRSVETSELFFANIGMEKAIQQRKRETEADVALKELFDVVTK